MQRPSTSPCRRLYKYRSRDTSLGIFRDRKTTQKRPQTPTSSLYSTIQYIGQMRCQVYKRRKLQPIESDQAIDAFDYVVDRIGLEHRSAILKRHHYNAHYQFHYRHSHKELEPFIL